MKKARKATDKMFDKAKTAPRPEPEKEVRQLESRLLPERVLYLGEFKTPLRRG
jgi:hypothetical protein